MIQGRLGYAAALCVGAGFYIFYNRWLSFFILLLLLVLPLVSLALCWPAARRVTVSLSSEVDAVQKGQDAVFLLSFRNCGVLPLACAGCVLQVKNALDKPEKPKKVRLALAGKRTSGVEYTVSSAYCGALECTADKLVAHDYLGIFSFSLCKGKRAGVMVLPRAVVIASEVTAPALPDDSGEHYGSRPGGGDPAQMLDLRAYQPGDSLRAIHWKLSGRTEGILVREFALPTTPSVELLVNLEGTAMGRDLILDAFYSIARYLLDCHIPYGVSWYDGALRRRLVAAEESFDEVLALLLRAGGRAALEAWVAREDQGGCRLVYFAARWDGAERVALRRLDHVTVLTAEGTEHGAVLLKRETLADTLTRLVI